MFFHATVCPECEEELCTYCGGCLNENCGNRCDVLDADDKVGTF